MTTKTIPEYLEDERRKNTNTQRLTEEDAARIQALHHGHHRTPKPPKPELPAPVGAVAKARHTTFDKARKTVAAKTRKPAAAAGKSQPRSEKQERKPARLRDDLTILTA